jgi:thymidylate synthase
MRPGIPIAHYAWRNLLNKIIDNGDIVAPRGKLTKELLGHVTKFDMARPVVVDEMRKLGYRFMCAEAAWILSGDNRVATIAPYSKVISRFSDDGVFFFGAYGPRIRDQVRHVVAALVNDPDTRQAVIEIWRPNPPITKDVPCTLTVQFMLRDGKLDCFVNMRSSDVWLGVPYDWFNFSMLTGYVCLLLRDKTGDAVRPGVMHFNAASQHLYEENRERAEYWWPTCGTWPRASSTPAGSTSWSTSSAGW